MEPSSLIILVSVITAVIPVFGMALTVVASCPFKVAKKRMLISLFAVVLTILCQLAAMTGGANYYESSVEVFYQTHNKIFCHHFG